jgi:hypothetical protein
METRYLRHKTTGVVHIRTDLLAKHESMEPYSPVVEMSQEEREARVLVAVESVPQESWLLVAGGKYSVPKVGDVSAAAGFKVRMVEIEAALGVK